MIHKRTLDNYSGNFAELAEELGNLRYDALATFLSLLATKIREDGEKDRSRGRVKLARSLHDCADKLQEANVAIAEAWRISKPFMR